MFESCDVILDSELKQDSPWHTLKGTFMNVSVYSIPANCEIAPQGLSKVTHLNDGNIDLVVVRTAERKEFIRFLRRHGNSKDQVCYGFCKTGKSVKTEDLWKLFCFIVDCFGNKLSSFREN